MKIIKHLFPALLFLIFCTNIMGADLCYSPDSIKPDIYVYLHNDRSYYHPGESISFKAYFLDNRDNMSYPSGDTLFVALIDQDGLETANGRYPVTNNLISGKVELPEALTEGNYMLIAYTFKSKDNSPEKMFSRVIEIRNDVEDNLNTKLSLKDTIYEPGSMLIAQIRFSRRNNNPVSAGFTYQLTGKSGEIFKGKSKTDNKGSATLNLKLPEFAGNDDLKLLIDPSDKGAEKMGIVIPTRFNEKIHPGSVMLSGDIRHLNIKLKTTNLSDKNGDKVELDISVTDETGVPVMANLSVSASKLINHKVYYGTDDILSFISGKIKSQTTYPGTERIKYFTGRLLQITQDPGTPYIVQEKNNPKKLNKKGNPLYQKNQIGYPADRNIFNIIMQIRPYHIESGKIIFSMTAQNSINNIEGAIIVVDGIKMGTDVSILDNIPVPDIAHINVSTNVMDTQRYSALNSAGVIEIFMKKSNEFLVQENSSGKKRSDTLFWGPDIITDKSGNASVSFNTINKYSDVLITVVGVSSNGIYGSLKFTVK